MFDPSKLTFGFDDLSICPKIKATDRKIAVDKNCVLQKNGKSRFLITIRDANDLSLAAKDKSNYYIAKFNDVELLMSIMFDSNFDNIIPQFDVKDLLANKKMIMANLVESKDKFDVIINIGENIGDLFELRSLENAEFMSLFNAIYRVNGNDVTVSMLCDMKGLGIIVDRTIGNLAISSGASSISRCFRSVSNAFGSDAIKYVDLLEATKNNYVRVIADYDKDDPFAIKTVALGAQFIVLDMPIDDAKNKIAEIEEMWLRFLRFVNSSDFNDLFRYVECGLISK